MVGGGEKRCKYIQWLITRKQIGLFSPIPHGRLLYCWRRDRQWCIRITLHCKCWAGLGPEPSLLGGRAGLCMPGWMLLSCWNISQQWAGITGSRTWGMFCPAFAVLRSGWGNGGCHLCTTTGYFPFLKILYSREGLTALHLLFSDTSYLNSPSSEMQPFCMSRQWNCDKWLERVGILKPCLSCTTAKDKQNQNFSCKQGRRRRINSCKCLDSTSGSHMQRRFSSFLPLPLANPLGALSAVMMGWTERTKEGKQDKI